MRVLLDLYPQGSFHNTTKNKNIHEHVWFFVFNLQLCVFGTNLDGLAQDCMFTQR